MPQPSRERVPVTGTRTGATGADALLALSFLAIATLFLHDVALSGRAYLLREVLDRFHPWLVAARESVRAGALPFWSHDNYCGAPLLANIRSGVFYPPNWLTWVLPFDIALTTLMVLHLALAAIFTRGFLRRVGVVDPAAFAGGALFAFGTWTMSHLGTPTKLGSAIWIPLAWSGIWQAMRAGSRRGVGLAALATALSLLSGSPEITALGLLSATVLALLLAAGMFRAKELTIGERAGRLLALPAVVVLGGLVAGVQLAPAWETLSRSEGVTGDPSDVGTPGAALAPEAVGQPDPLFLAVPGGDRSREASENSARSTLDIGVPALVLVFASLPAFRRLRRTRRVRREDLARPVETAVMPRVVPWFLVSGAAAGSVVALGHLSALERWLHARIPGLAGLGDPADASLLLVMHLAPLAAVGLACLRHGASRWRTAGAGAIALGVTLLAVSILARGPLADFFRSWQAAGMPDARLAAGGVPHPEWTGVLATRGGLALVAGALAIALATRAPAALGWCWTALLIVDLFLVSGSPALPAAKGFYDRIDPETVALRADLAGRRIHTSRDVERLGSALDGCRNPVAFEWARGAFVGNVNVPAGVAQVRGAGPSASPRHEELAHLFDAPGTPPAIRERLLDLWDAARVVEAGGVRPGDLPGLRDPGAGTVLRAYEPRLGRATLVSGWRTLADGTSVLDGLLQPSHDPAHTTLLETAADGTRPDPPAREPTVRCEPVGYELFPNRIRAAWHVGEGGMLRVLESWAPGWRALVNGQPAPVYRADYLHLAVPVPPGSVVVELEYRPATFPAGVTASVAGVLGLLACFVGGRRRAVIAPPTRRVAPSRAPTPGPHGASSPGAPGAVTRTGARRAEVR